MGNLESIQKKYTLEQLKQTEKNDIQILSILDAEVFDDNFVIQKHLSDLESNLNQYVLDDEKLSSLIKAKEKWKNTELALECLNQDFGGFKEDEIKYLRKQISHLSAEGPNGFATLFELRLELILKIHQALIRRKERLRLKKNQPIPDDQEISSKADYVMNLFSGSEDKIMDILLTRLHELPKLENLQLIEESMEEEKDADTAEEQEETMQIDEKIDTNSGEPFEKGLMCLLLNGVMEETKNSLKLDKNSPVPNSNAVVIPSPSLRLLQALQKDLLQQAACMLDCNNIPTKNLLYYSKVVFQVSLEIFAAASQVNSILTDGLQDKLDIRIQHVLKGSFIFHLLPSLAICLYQLIARTSYEDFVLEILPIVIPLLKIMDDFNSISNDFQVAEKQHLEATSSSIVQTIEVESPHNYYPNTDEEKIVHIPGVTHLYVTFDPRCSTDQGQDFLQLYKKPNKEDPILTPFSGKPEMWPKVPILVEGDTVVFHFYTDPFATYWGYRCIVTGMVLQFSRAWLFDLQLTISWLLKRLLRRAICSRVTESERSMEIWLDSPLFRGGEQEFSLEENGFINDFIENRNGTLANSLIKVIEKQIPPNPAIDRMGGDLLSNSLRYFIIAMIKHLGLLPKVMKSERNIGTDKLLVKIWLESRKLRQWIGGERRKILLEREESMENNVQQNNQENDKETSNSVDKASYEYLCNDLVKKMEFLLKLAPAFSINEEVNVSQFIPESLDSNLRTKKKFVNLRASQDSHSLDQWKELFNTWRSLQQMSSPKSRKKQMLTSIPELITKFIQKAPLEELKWFLARRKQRALQRINLFKTLRDLIKGLKNMSSKQVVISMLGSAFRNLKDADTSGHYLCNLKSCGIGCEIDVKNSFFVLYNTLVAMFNDPSIPLSFRKIIVDALCIGWAAEDHEFMMKIFPSLHEQLLSNDTDTRLNKECFLAFRLLCMYCVGNVREKGMSPPITPKDLDPMQKYVLELLVDDVEQSMDNFKYLKAQIAKKELNNSKVIFKYYKIEQFLHDILFTLSISTQTVASLQFLSDPKNIRLLLRIHHVGTPRLKRLALRILRRSLAAISPALVADWDLASEFGKDQNIVGVGFIPYFFQLIGNALYIDELENPTPPPSDQDYNTGEILLANTSEVVMLMRFLLSENSWNAALTEAINLSLKQIPSLVDVKTSSVRRVDKQIIWSGLAALCIIGGDVDPVISVGGRIQIQSTKERGTVADCDRLSATTKVILDNDPGKVVECPMEKLVAIPEIPMDPKKFVITPDLITSFMIFMSQPEVTKSDNMKLTKEEEPIQLEWACNICTYNNLMSVDFCAICSSPKQITQLPFNQEVSNNQQEESIFKADINFHQLKSRTLKSLSVLLSNSTACLLLPGVMRSLLSMAVRPSQLVEFRSVEQLDVKEERMLELIYQSNHSIVEDTLQKRSSQAEILKYSPFCNLPLFLPSMLDRGSAKRAIFPTSDLRMVMRSPEYNNNLALVRANLAIPNSIPAYYFEIKIIAGETTMDIVEGGLNVAIGLYREGTELEGLPGNSNSFAYQGNKGELHHNVGSLRTSRVLSIEYGPTFSVGDTVGCGWNIRSNEIYFTKNGKFLGNGFDHVNGRFYPAIWIGDHCKILVNFGNEPFEFNFVGTLPEGYISSLQDVEKSTKGMSAAELKRRTMAEDLMMMMDIFPKELCIIALERNRDDINYAAAWLLENGFKELERMSNEILQKSEREDREREERQIMETVLEEQRALGQFVEQQEKKPHLKGDEEKYEVIEEEQFEEEEEEYENDSREAGRFLDDEIGVDAPVQIERERNQSKQFMEDLKVEDVFPGMLLSVLSAISENEFINTTGRTGVVTEVDHNKMRIKLKFISSETASVYSFWFPFHILKRPFIMWQDPCIELRNSTSNQLKKAFVQLETTLSILRVRRTVLNIISQWVDFPFVELAKEDPQSLIDILKLAAAEFLASSTDVGMNENSPILNSFKEKFGAMLKVEESAKPEALRISNYKSERSGTLTQVLTEECIRHFVQAVEAPPPILIEESSHPYENNQDIRKCFHIKGANKLIIRFDPQCKIHKDDILTRFSFYRDEEYQDLLVTSKGNVSGQQFDPIIVDSDRVWFKFTSGAGETFWGYKFTIFPLKLRLNDEQALSGLNFELGYWLLELLLEKGPLYVRTIYIKDLYEALVYYISKSKRSAKARGVQLLLRVLQEIHSSLVKSIDLSPLTKLQPRIQKKYNIENSENRNLFYSAHLQSLVELIALTKLTEQSIYDSAKKRKNLTIDIIQANLRQLKITKAIYGVLSNKRLCKDVTNDLQKVTQENFGGNYLYIPEEFFLLSFLADDPAPGYSDKKLLIKYEFVETLTGKVVESDKKIVIPGESLILFQNSWFDDVMTVTEIVQNISKNSYDQPVVNFTDQLLLDTWCRDKLQKEYFWPLANDQPLFPENGIAFPDPGAYYAFTVTMSLFLSQENDGKAHNILIKGLIQTRSPGILLTANEPCIQFQVSSTTDSLEMCTSKRQIPQKTWTHIACVCDGKTLKIYINGNLEGEHTLQGRLITNCCPFFVNKLPLGVQPNEGSLDGIEGVIQNMRFYLRPLKEEEIKALSEFTLKKSGEILLKPPTTTSQEFEQFLNHTQWTLAMDEQLVEMMNNIAEQRDLLELSLDTITFPTELINRFHLIRQIPVTILKFRFSVIKQFNLKLTTTLPLIDFSQSHLPWSLAHSLMQLKGVIFMSTKLQLWNKIIANTNIQRSSTHVTIDRPRALKAKERGDPDGSKSVFGQLFRQLHFLPPAQLRRRGQVWRVEYKGEGGTDAGGLFRDCISHSCSDLQSPYVPLFIPVPNSKGFGDNQEKFIPNPNASSSLQLSMFAFVGKLMGIAIRAKLPLNLDFPSILWKQIVQSHITRADLEAIDAFSYKMFDQVMNAENQEGMDEQTFEETIDLVFTTISSAGTEVDLVPGGKNKKVTWQNRKEYVTLLEQYRLNEFKTQIEAIKNGLGTIVPLKLLSLFTWQELELSVCGKREISIDLLKENTKCAGYKKNDKNIEMFWNVLKGFSSEERQLFLRFVWGRSRLPLRSEDFDQKFVIMESPDNNDVTLPISHTCFFQLELPQYSSEEVMKRKLLYAITECRAIDTDHAAQTYDWDAEED